MIQRCADTTLRLEWFGSGPGWLAEAIYRGRVIDSVWVSKPEQAEKWFESMGYGPRPSAAEPVDRDD